MDDRQFARIAKALADPRRVEILERIAKAPDIVCGALVEQLDVGQSTVSHHLKTLKDADLIDVRREGQLSRMTTRSEVVNAYLEELRKRVVASA